VELVDTQDLKSCSPQRECGFKSRPGHFFLSSLYRFRLNLNILLKWFWFSPVENLHYH